MNLDHTGDPPIEVGFEHFEAIQEFPRDTPLWTEACDDYGLDSAQRIFYSLMSCSVPVFKTYAFSRGDMVFTRGEEVVNAHV